MQRKLMLSIKFHCCFLLKLKKKKSQRLGFESGCSPSRREGTKPPCPVSGWAPSSRGAPQLLSAHRILGQSQRTTRNSAIRTRHLYTAKNQLPVLYVLKRWQGTAQSPELPLQTFAALDCAERGYNCSVSSGSSLSTRKVIADPAQNRRKRSIQEEITKFRNYEAR